MVADNNDDNIDNNNDNSNNNNDNNHDNITLIIEISKSNEISR